MMEERMEEKRKMNKMEGEEERWRRGEKDVAGGKDGGDKGGNENVGGENDGRGGGGGE
jgi:hypothetical protein